MHYAIGIDVGATNAKALAVSPQGEVLGFETGATSGTQWQENVRSVFSSLVQKVGPSPKWVGVAAPGLARPDRTAIAYMPGRLPGLEGLVWSEFLNTKCVVPVANDAQAALVGESWLGAARGAANAVLLTLGTGVGGAAMVDGAVLRGHIGRAGHVGHISLDPDGDPDVTGTPGSLEDAIGDCTVSTRSGGKYATTALLVEAMRRGDAQAKAVWHTSVRALAAGVCGLINVLDPEVVVIGGGIAKAGPLLFQPLGRLLAEFEWRPGGSRVRIVKARLGEKAGAFGAARNGIQTRRK